MWENRPGEEPVPFRDVGWGALGEDLEVEVLLEVVVK